MDLLLNIATTLYDAQNFYDIGKIVISILQQFTSNQLIGGKIGIFDKEYDEYRIYYDTFLDSKPDQTTLEIHEIVNKSCHFNEIKYFSRIVAESRNKLIIQNNHSEESTKIHPEQKFFEPQAMLWVPLLYRDQFLGIISIASKPINSINEQIIEMIDGIAKITSIKVFELLTTTKLTKSEIKLSSIINSMDDIVYVLDKEGVFIECYNSNLNLLNLHSTDLIGKNYNNLNIPKFFKDNLDLAYIQILGKNHIYEFDYSPQDKSLTRWYNVKISRFNNPIYSFDGVTIVSRDITDRKLSEEALRESENNFRILFEESPIPTSISEIPTGIIIYANQIFLESLGLDKEQVVGKRAIDLGLLSNPADQENLTSLIISKGRIDNLEVESFNLSGDKVTDLISMRIIKMRDKIYCLTTILDISKIKQSEEALRESEEKYKRIVDTTSEGIIVIDEKAIITFANPQMAMMIGYTEKEIFNMPYKNILHEDDLKMYEEQLISRRKGHSGQYEIRLRNKDGKILWVSVSATPLFDSYNNFFGSFGMFTDITSRKESEKKLLLTEYSLDYASDSVFWFLPNAELTYTNQTASKNLLYSEEQLLKMNVVDIFPSITLKTWDHYRNMLLNTKSITIESEYKKRDGCLVPAEIRINFIKFKGDEYFFALAHDITERKRVEHELRMHAHTVKSISECVSITDIEDNILFVNDAFMNTYGYSKSELLGKCIAVVGSPNNDKKMVESILPNTLSGGWHGEILNRRKDGSDFPIYLSTSPVHDELGTIIALVGVASDITERKQSEQLLRISEERFKQVAENAEEWIWEVDSIGKYTFCSSAVERILGYNANELAGKKYFYDLFAPEEKVKMKNTIFNAFADKQSFRRFINSKVHKSGRIVIVETSFTPILDSDRECLGYRGVDTDITERLKAEMELQSSENELRTLFSAINDVILILDDNGTYLKIAPTNPSLLYKPLEDLLGKRFDEVMPEETANFFISCIRKTLKEKLNNSVEYKLPIGEKEVVFSARISPLSEHSVVWVARDITEQKNAELEHLRLQNLESLGILAGGIAHDFNNILTSIMGQSSIAHLRTKEENTKKSISSILEATKRAVGLTQQLLTFAKGGTPQKTIISIRKIIEDTSTFSLSGSNVQPSFEFKDTFKLDADPAQISQVVQNIVINAKQAMPDGGIIKISTEDVLEDEKLFVRIRIKDSGIGIPKSYLDKIFNPYFTTKQTGSGLGLSVCHSIVIRHGGKISIDSQVEIGTTFEILLPASEVTIEQSVEEQNKVLQKMKLLIMDDEDQVREILKEILNELGHEVTATSEGYETIKYYKQSLEDKNPYDIVFLDLTVKGGLGGRDTAKKLRELFPDVKIIVSSGYADTSISSFREDGFDASLNKPYTIEEVNNIIFQMLK